MKHAVTDLVKGGTSLEITVSCDSTWQKRYGRNTLQLGATFIISIDNGCLLLTILSKVKHVLCVIKILILQMSGVEIMSCFAK